MVLLRCGRGMLFERAGADLTVVARPVTASTRPTLIECFVPTSTGFRCQIAHRESFYGFGFGFGRYSAGISLPGLSLSQEMVTTHHRFASFNN